jgi:hypothetical protein
MAQQAEDVVSRVAAELRRGSTEQHECPAIRGRAQMVLKKSQFLGNQGPQVWHLVCPMPDPAVIFIIEFCPFCGARLE